MKKFNVLKFDILRHGETTLSHTLRGRTDDDLTEQGWRDMQMTIQQALQSPLQWQLIVTSPLKRCAQFAEQLSQQLQLPLIYQSGLQEMDFGDWEAQSTADLYAKSPQLLADFWQFPTRYTPPNAESLLDFQCRVLDAIEMLQLQMREQNWTHALLISHGGVIKLLKCLAKQQSLDDILTQSAPLGQLNSFWLNREKKILLSEDVMQ